MSRNHVRTMRQAEAYARYQRFQSLYRRSTAKNRLERFWDSLVEAMTADVEDTEALRKWAGL